MLALGLPSSLLFILILLTATAGVSHWKLQDGVIKAVVGKPVITDGHNNEGNSDSTSNDHVIHDKELYFLTSHLRKNVSPPSSSSPTTSSSSRKLKLKITQHKAGGNSGITKKGSSNNRCNNNNNNNNNNNGGSSSKSEVSKESSCNVKHNPSSEGTCRTAAIKRDVPGKLMSCGEPVEYTAYDFLEGVARRNELRRHPEPDVALIFRKTAEDQSVDLTEVESLLKKLLRDNPNDAQVLNQVGNLWRVKGNTQHAIECFRRALTISPNNPDVLLNLGRVLYNLKFYDNTIFLVKRSLQQDQIHSETWLHHYTLGEAYKAVNNYREAVVHFKKALEYNPTLHMAEAHVRDMERQNGLTYLYTAVIILTLATLVLIMIYYFFCNSSTNYNDYL